MACRNCGRPSEGNLCRQCRFDKIESEALEYDSNEWGQEAGEVKCRPGAKLRGAEEIKKKWRKK